MPTAALLISPTELDSFLAEEEMSNDKSKTSDSQARPMRELLESMLDEYKHGIEEMRAVKNDIQQLELRLERRDRELAPVLDIVRGSTKEPNLVGIIQGIQKSASDQGVRLDVFERRLNEHDENRHAFRNEMSQKFLEAATQQATMERRQAGKDWKFLVTIVGWALLAVGLLWTFLKDHIK
jgi:septal ring factor EnvC (AmiA/AmiB activator)